MLNFKRPLLFLAAALSFTMVKSQDELLRKTFINKGTFSIASFAGGLNAVTYGDKLIGSSIIGNGFAYAFQAEYFLLNRFSVAASRTFRSSSIFFEQRDYYLFTTSNGFTANLKYYPKLRNNFLFVTAGYAYAKLRSSDPIEFPSGSGQALFAGVGFNYMPKKLLGKPNNHFGIEFSLQVPVLFKGIVPSAGGGLGIRYSITR